MKKEVKKEARGDDEGDDASTTLRAMTVAQLRSLAESRGLAPAPRLLKEQLVQLLASRKRTRAPDSPRLSLPELRAKTVAQLRDLATARGLSPESRMLKEQLVQLLAK